MQKYLTQALIRESIERLEEAARTTDEFEEVVDWWDKLDKRVQDAFDKVVWSTDSEQFDWNAYSANLEQTDILNVIFNCICQMHNLIEDNDLSRLIEKATDKQKEVFFLRVIRGCSPQRIAVCLDMTDRNVRDISDRMTQNIRKGFYIILKRRGEENIPLNKQEIEFLDNIEREM